MLGAAEQRDEADEGRVEAERSMVDGNCQGVAGTKHHGAGVRPSQLIASVLRTRVLERCGRRTPSAGGHGQDFAAVACGSRLAPRFEKGADDEGEGEAVGRGRRPGRER